MTVQELIDALSKIEDKSKPVFIDIIESEVLDIVEFENAIKLFDY